MTTLKLNNSGIYSFELKGKLVEATLEMVNSKGYSEINEEFHASHDDLRFDINELELKGKDASLIKETLAFSISYCS